jgi:multidrug efflux pump subunit AcrB
MNFRNVSAWAIRNPVPPLVLFAALLLAGIISFIRLDVNDSPDIVFPGVIVRVVQPGAAPTELETQVTQRVEAAVRAVSGIEEITSTVREGSSDTFVQFQMDTPVDRAVADTKNAVDQIRSELPDGILEPQVTRVDFNDEVAGFSAQAVDMTLEELSWYVDNTVAKRLVGISGMAKVERGGGVDREIRIVLDPAKLQSQGVTAAQVNAQLRQTNVNAAGGRAEIAGSEQSVRVLGNAKSAYDLGQTQISVGGGRTVKLADLAEVKDAYAEQRSFGELNGRQMVSFFITRAKGASDVEVYHATEKMLEDLHKENPKVTFGLLFNDTEYTERQYESAIEAMVEGAILAVIVVFLFLRDWRATVISSLAIPLAAIPTFWFMDLMGFSLNFISLLALSLVAGVLVDDAIVEIENIVRHMRMGKTAYQAAIEAADEIGLAVLATTMAIVAVFLPVGLMPGIAGQFFKQFGFTVVAAVLMSLAVARLITPMIAAYFLKSHGQEPHGAGWAMARYLDLLRWSLVHRWKTVLMGGVAFAATIVAFATLPLTFQPTEDTPFSNVTIEMPPGTTLAQTAAIADEAERIIKTAPEVEQVVQRVNAGNARLNITLKKKRDRTSVEFERSLNPQLAAIADARVSFRSQSGGQSGRDISITLGGDDPLLLNQAAQAVVDDMSKMSEVRAPRVQGDLLRPEITIKPRMDLAADLGVTTAALSQTIRIATLGDIDQNSAKFSLSDRQIPIRVLLDQTSRRSLATIENLPVPTTTGGSVPLKVVADIGFGAGPSVIQRNNQTRRITIGADLAPGLVTGDALPKIHALASMTNLPEGVKELQLGDTKWQAELLVNFVIAVVSGILLVFAVLVLLYKKIMPPLVNLGSLLLAPLGAGLALHISGDAVSMPVFIGLLMLLGIVAKNSILLLDFALEEMGKGVEKVTAIIDAGHKRAQPIVMTTVAMVAGMVPTALALSGGSSWRAPMGVTVIGGLIVSTILTLVIVPASFSLAIDMEKWLGRRFGRLITHDGDGYEGQPEPQPAE